MSRRPTYYRIRHTYWTTVIEVITKCSITANYSESTGYLVLLRAGNGSHGVDGSVDGPVDGSDAMLWCVLL
jgi:hypothetical protein